MTTFQRETFAQVIEEIKPLLDKHWEEIAHFHDIALDPNYAMYRKAEEAGKLRVFTARKDGALVGYAVFITGNLHYQSTSTAMQDILFLLPEHRGFTGYRLIKFADSELAKEGVQITYHHVKVAHDFGPLLERMGYVPVDIIYARRH